MSEWRQCIHFREGFYINEKGEIMKEKEFLRIGSIFWESAPFFSCQSWAVYENFKNIRARSPSEDVKWKLGFKWLLSASFPPLSLHLHSSFSPPSYLFSSCLPCFLSLPFTVGSHHGVFEQHGNISSKAASSETVVRSFSQPAPWNPLVPARCLLTVADSLLIKKGQRL